MHSIHFDELHVPKSHGLFYGSIGALALFAFGLLTFLVAWFGGGRDVTSQLGGQVTLAVLLIGTVASAVLAALTNPKDWKPD
jgi:ABC-type phosphate transport system permease subunit